MIRFCHAFFFQTQIFHLIYQDKNIHCKPRSNSSLLFGNLLRARLKQLGELILRHLLLHPKARKKFLSFTGPILSIPRPSGCLISSFSFKRNLPAARLETVPNRFQQLRYLSVRSSSTSRKWRNRSVRTTYSGTLHLCPQNQRRSRNLKADKLDRKTQTTLV